MWLIAPGLSAHATHEERVECSSPSVSWRCAEASRSASRWEGSLSLGDIVADRDGSSAQVDDLDEVRMAGLFTSVVVVASMGRIDRAGGHRIGLIVCRVEHRVRPSGGGVSASIEPTWILAERPLGVLWSSRRPRRAARRSVHGRALGEQAAAGRGEQQRPHQARPGQGDLQGHPGAQRGAQEVSRGHTEMVQRVEDVGEGVQRAPQWRVVRRL